MFAGKVDEWEEVQQPRHSALIPAWRRCECVNAGTVRPRWQIFCHNTRHLLQSSCKHKEAERLQQGLQVGHGHILQLQDYELDMT